MTEHAHTWHSYVTIMRAPIDPADPVGHTSFIVLRCPGCNLATVFPLLNYWLTTRSYRDELIGELAAVGVTLTPALDDDTLDRLREAVADGAGHECDEWRHAVGSPCALCGAQWR